jgi:hypothetical protein
MTHESMNVALDHVLTFYKAIIVSSLVVLV